MQAFSAAGQEMYQSQAAEGEGDESAEGEADAETDAEDEAADEEVIEADYEIVDEEGSPS